MKNKLLFFFLFIIVYSTGYTQTEKGSWIISLHGNARFDVNTPAFLQSSLGIKTSGQKLIMDNLGFGVSYLSSLPGADYYSFEAGAFIRQYIGKYDVKPYLEITPGIDFKNYPSHNQVEFFLKPGVGVIYWFHKNVGVDTNINLNIFSNPAELHWNFGVNVSF